MKLAILLLVGMAIAGHDAAVCAPARAAKPFPEIPVGSDQKANHTWAYATMAAGAGMVVLSFALSSRADHVYHDYLLATDPDRIEDLYDESVRYDWAARGTLVGGELLIAAGLYLRFVRPLGSGRAALVVEPWRCALALRF